MQKYNKVTEMTASQIGKMLEEITLIEGIVECVFKKYAQRETYLLIDVNKDEEWFVVSSGIGKKPKFKKILFNDVRVVDYNFSLSGSSFQKKLPDVKSFYEQSKN